VAKPPEQLDSAIEFQPTEGWTNACYVQKLCCRRKWKSLTLWYSRWLSPLVRHKAPWN